MFVDAPLQQQIADQRQDRLRVLVVGAGVAGLTLAQALRAGGLRPVLVERSTDHADQGYMLALMPLVDPVLRQLDVMDAYREHSGCFHRYVLHGRHGQLLREYTIDTLLSSYGEYRGIARGALMRVLASRGAPVSYATTLQAISQTAGAVHATLRSGDIAVEAEFDAVVMADGLHSTSRELLLSEEQVSFYDSGWGGWVAWMGSDVAHADRGDEVWGADFFLGIYPTQGRAGVFLGDQRDAGPRDAASFVKHVRAQLRGNDAWIEHALSAVEHDPDPYYWKFIDCRSATWTAGRVALLGDAAAGFLPTAGVGAGMAMESAGVLARRMLASDRTTVVAAMRDYERVQRPRVESAQDNSRALAKLMFRSGRGLAWLRDIVARFVTLKAALRPIIKLLEELPE